MTRNVKPAVGAGGKHKKKKSCAEDDKTEFKWKHHNHGDKRRHLVHQIKPVVCVESKDDHIGADLAHLVVEEKKHHHHHRHRVHHEEDHHTVAY